MSPKHYQFILEYLQCGDKIEAYQKVYPEATGRSVSNGADRLLANREIEATINLVRMQIRYETEENLREIISGTYLTMKEKRMVLAQIARGDLTVTVERPNAPYSGSYVHIEPTHRERIMAIRLDCEIEAGKYTSEELNKKMQYILNNIPDIKKAS